MTYPECEPPKGYLRVYRITSAAYADSAYDGVGAQRFGARWNPPGIRVAYASSSLSLAVLELIAQGQALTRLAEYRLAVADLPQKGEVLRAELPEDWRRFPAPDSTKKVGLAWVNGQTSLVLRVPSAILPSEANYLVNPAHPDFAKAILHPATSLDLDPRLLP